MGIVIEILNLKTIQLQTQHSCSQILENANRLGQSNFLFVVNWGKGLQISRRQLYSPLESLYSNSYIVIMTQI